MVSTQQDWFSFKLQENWASKFTPRRIFSIFPYKMCLMQELYDSSFGWNGLMSLRKKRINSYCFMQKILYVLSSLDSASTQKILQKISNFFSDDQTFLIMLQDFRPATLLKDTPTQVFSCECCEIFKRNFLQNISGRPLLKIFPGGD